MKLLLEIWFLIFCFHLFKINRAITIYSTASRDTIITQQIPSEFLVDNQNTKRIASIQTNSTVPFNYQFIQESNNLTYFSTSFDYPINITLNFIFKNRTKSVHKNVELIIKKSEIDYNYRLSILFKNLSITQFLTKSEQELHEYFETKLRNPSIIITSVEVVRDYLRVIVGSHYPFSSETFIFQNESCSYENGQFIETKRPFTKSFIHNFNKSFGLYLEECSMIFFKIQPTAFYKPFIQTTLFIEIANFSFVSSSSNILLIIMIILHIILVFNHQLCTNV